MINISLNKILSKTYYHARVRCNIASKQPPSANPQKELKIEVLKNAMRNQKRFPQAWDIKSQWNVRHIAEQ